MRMPPKMKATAEHFIHKMAHMYTLLLQSAQYVVPTKYKFAIIYTPELVLYCAQYIKTVLTKMKQLM